MDVAGLPVSINMGAAGAQPLVTSASKFAHAVISVILPALIDLPRAQLQWMALASTVLELYSRSVHLGEARAWTLAYNYLLELLTERALTGKDFAEPSVACLNNWNFSGSASAVVQGAAGPKQFVVKKPGQLCNNFNNHGGCYRGELDCSFDHVCSACAQRGHGASNCPLGAAGGAGVPNQSRSSGGSRRGGGRGGRGSRGGSVRTAEPPAAAAAGGSAP